jgi:hypothetical protein
MKRCDYGSQVGDDDTSQRTVPHEDIIVVGG